MTPLEIEILLHYHCRATDYRDGDFSAPAVKETIERFRADGLIAELIFQPIPKTGRGHAPAPRYALTERGQAMVDALCAVPLPSWEPGRWITSWLRPATASNYAPADDLP